MATTIKKCGQLQEASLRLSIEPRHLRSGETWFDPDKGSTFQETLLALVLNGELPKWPAIIPPELRVSRKLGFRIEDEIVVVAGIGLVQRDRDSVVVSTPQFDVRGAEGTIIHDSYISQLDLKRDPLGGLSKGTLFLALRRMESARASAGSMAIIPRILAHGIMHRGKAEEMGFLVYSYPAHVKKPSAWLANTDEFDRGMENTARFLAALHRQGFHGSLYRPGSGFANILWTTDGRMTPVVTGWGQHAGLSSKEMMTRDVRDLIEAGFCQLVSQGLPDVSALSLDLVRRVLMAYGQLCAAFRQQEFDFQSDPLAGFRNGLDALTDKGGVVEKYVARLA